MPKIYDQKQEPEKGTGGRSSFEGPGHERTQKRGMVIAIVVILAIVVLVMLIRMARGEVIQGVGAGLSAPSTSSYLSLTEYRSFSDMRTFPAAWWEGAINPG